MVSTVVLCYQGALFAVYQSNHRRGSQRADGDMASRGCRAELRGTDLLSACMEPAHPTVASSLDPLRTAVPTGLPPLRRSKRGAFGLHGLLRQGGSNGRIAP